MASSQVSNGAFPPVRTMARVERAKAFAINAHTDIGHRRKYTKLLYAEHLQNVVTLVAKVTDDPEMWAAAWLLDVMKDTTATLEDVEAPFGKRVAALVEALTDVSGHSDGNRAASSGARGRIAAVGENQISTK